MAMVLAFPRKKKKTDKNSLGSLVAGTTGKPGKTGETKASGASAATPTAKPVDAKATQSGTAGPAKPTSGLDEATNTWRFRRQSLDELKGNDLMSKWRNSEVYKDTNRIAGINRWQDITAGGIAAARGSNRVLASDHRQAEQDRSALKSMDYQLRQQASRERADAFYELWKENNRKAREGKTPKETPVKTPEQAVKATVDGAIKQNTQNAADVANKPLNGIPADQVQGSVASAKALEAENNKFTQPQETPSTVKPEGTMVPFKQVDSTAPVNPESKKPYDDMQSFIATPIYAAMKAGYSSLGSDGRYHKFSLSTRADYKGGSTAKKQEGVVGSSTKFNFDGDPLEKTARRAAKNTQYLDSNGQVTAARQKEIDAEMAKGGTKIFVNGVELRRTPEAELAAKGAKTAGEWRQKWNSLIQKGKDANAELQGSLSSPSSGYFFTDKYTGERLTNARVARDARAGTMIREYADARKRYEDEFNRQLAGVIAHRKQNEEQHPSQNQSQERETRTDRNTPYARQILQYGRTGARKAWDWHYENMSKVGDSVGRAIGETWQSQRDSAIKRSYEMGGYGKKRDYSKYLRRYHYGR